MTKKDTCAKIIRILSIPPIMITTLIILLSVYRHDIFNHWSDMALSILFLGIIPVLAYPIQILVPSLKKKGRTEQRKLAFIFSIAGYSLALIWSIFFNASKQLELICSTYCISVLLLTFFNKIIHIRASGHACSVTGPLLFLIYFMDWKLCIPCIIFSLLIVWSSLYLKRHTKKDLAMGSLVCVIAFLFSLIIIY